MLLIKIFVGCVKMYKKNCMYIFFNFKINYNCVLDCFIIKKYMLLKVCIGRKYLVIKKNEKGILVLF